MVIRGILAAAALAAMAGGAHAACNVSGVGVFFGPYDPLSAFGAAVSGNVTVDCDQSPAPDVAIMIGPSGTSGGFFPRQMRQEGGSATLAYNLFVDSGTSAIWGDGTGGTSIRSDRVAKNKPWTATIYGRIPGNQDVPAGNYGDSLLVTINF